MPKVNKNSKTANKKLSGMASTMIVRAPVSLGGISRNGTPKIKSDPHGMTITHSENISTMPLTALGVLNYFRLALIPALCPYLNGLASNFGKWKWLKLRIRYVPACPSNLDGESVMGLTFDRQDAAAATFVQVASMSHSISFPPWGGFNGGQSVVMDVDCNRFDKNRYSFMFPAAFAGLSPSDQNNYCPVTANFATQGSTAGSTVGGRIWLDYTVQLTDPVLPAVNF